jgi:hypothetical protein
MRDVADWCQYEYTGTYAVPRANNGYCLATSVAIVANYFGGNSSLNASLNALIDARLVEGGLDRNGLVYDRSTASVRAVLGGTYTAGPSLEWPSLADIKGFLDRGLCIAEVPGHFVVLVGYQGDTLYVNDPGYSDGGPVPFSYGMPITAVLYTGTPSEPPATSDTTPPTTNVAGADALWHNAPVGLSFGAQDNDGGSGMSGGAAKTEYNLDGGGWVTGGAMTVPAPANTTVVHTIQFRSTDAAGNAEGAKSCTVKIDTAAPVSTMSGADDLWHNTPVTVSLAGADGGSGMSGGAAKTEYQLDGGGWVTASGLSVPAPANTSVVHTILFRSTDAIGNVESARSCTVRIDTAPPVTTASGVDDLWHSAPVPVTFAAVDAVGGSGMSGGFAKTEYQLDGGAWTTGVGVTVPAPADTTAVHTIRHRSVDNAGNVEATKVVTVKIDTAPPDTTISGEDRLWHNAPVVVSFAASDAGSGMIGGGAKTEYRLDEGPWTTGTSLTVPAPADVSVVHTVHVRSVDCLGNVEAAHNFRVKIDTTPPVSTTNGVAKYWFIEPVRLRFEADDLGQDKSGLAYVEYKLDDGPWTQGTSLVVPAPPETRLNHTVMYRSVDVAGNVESAHSIAFGITTVKEQPGTLPASKFALLAGVIGGRGLISPAGLLSVLRGSTPTFAFIPEPGFHVSLVTVDGVPVAMTGANSYTFPRVTAEHVIAVSFAPDGGPLGIATITPLVVGGHGSVTPAGPQSVALGATPTFSFTPDAGYALAELRLDGALVTPTAAGSYTFPALGADHVLSVSFTRGASALGILTVAAPSPAAVKRGGTASLPFRVNQVGLSGLADVTITITDKTGRVVARKGARSVPLNAPQSLRFTCELARGTYEFSVSAVSAVGARSVKSASNTLTVR